MFHGQKTSLKTQPLLSKSTGILLKGLLLKVAILANKNENFWKIPKSLKNQKTTEKKNNPCIPERIPKNKKWKTYEKTEPNPPKNTQKLKYKKRTNWTTISKKKKQKNKIQKKKKKNATTKQHQKSIKNKQ